jgi:chromosomal replication initiator protein
MYLCRELTKASLSEIGEAFGGRDHGTVIHACRTVQAKSAADEQIKQVIRSLTIQLNS